MIRRIVKLSLRSDAVENFKEVFESSKESILSQPGCHYVELLSDVSNPTLFFTFSLWDSEEDLNNYRETDFFKDVWSKTKGLFDDGKPEAWSLSRESNIVREEA